MTGKELKKLSRAELLEMLIAQSREVASLKEQLDDAVKQLNDRRILIDEAGSIAQAALSLNGVFEAAQNAAKEYTENIQRQADMLLADAQARCAALEAETQEKCAVMIQNAREQTKADQNGDFEGAADPADVKNA